MYFDQELFDIEASMSYFSIMNNTPITTAQRLYAAIAVGDLEEVAGLLDPDVVLRVPGDQPLAGTHHGIAGVLGFLAASAAVADAHEQIELLDLCGGAEHATAVCHVTGTRSGRADLDNLTVHVHRIVDGRITEIRFHNFDQANVDAVGRN